MKPVKKVIEVMRLIDIQSGAIAPFFIVTSIQEDGHWRCVCAKKIDVVLDYTK